MITLLGVKLECITPNEILRRVKETKKPFFIVTINPEILLHARSDPFYRQIINSADLRVVDGFGIVLIARALYGVKLHRFPGADLANEIVKWAAKNDILPTLKGGVSPLKENVISASIHPRNKSRGFLEASNNKRIFLLGGSRETNEEAIKRFRVQGLGVRGIGGLGGDFNEKEAIEKINEFNPDILFVALGAPRQEIFIHNLLTKPYTLNPIPSILVGIGGTIDYWAYPWLRAPNIARRMGLEWFWRLVLQPWRLLRILKATIIFPVACLWEKVLLQWSSEKH